MKEYKINIFKKIFISFLTLLLVFTSVTTYQFQYNKNIEVNAGFVDIRHKTMEVIAVVLALLGVGISEIQDSTVDYIYNNLEDNTKAIVNNVASTVTEGYALIQETDFKQLALELIKDYNLATMELGTSVAIGMYGDNILDAFKQNYFYPYNNGTVEKIYKSGLTEVARWTAIYRTFTYESNSLYDMIYTLTSLDKDYNGTFSRSSGISIPVGDASFQLKIESILGLAMGSELTPTLTGGPYLVYKHSCSVIYGTHDCKNGNGTNINGLMTLANGDNVFNVSLGLALLTTGGLTLPAPLGGWDTDDANDIDVPNDYTKRILEGLGLGGLVLGGLNGRTLEDLENMGPNDVIVDQETPTPFDNVGENDTTIEIPDSTDIPETNAGLGAWLGGALGVIGNAITGAIKGLLSGLSSILNSILGAILGIGSIIISSIIAALSQLFTWDFDATKLKFDELRGLMMLRIPCVNETINAWINVMSTNGHNLTSSFTLFGTTVTWNSGQLLAAFTGFASLIQNAFKFVFWFIFLKGMRRRITAFLSAMSVDMNIGGKI